VLLLALAGCRTTSPRPAFGIRLGGAQIATELVASWLGDAEDYRFVVEQVGPVYLSQHGFQNLRDGECDIACTDRMITPREQAEFDERGLQGYRVAFYGFALYVHPDNPLDSVYAGHLELLFQRKLTDWRELGTPYEGPIRLIGPEKSTRGGMILMRQANIWFDQPTWEPLESDLAIIDAVAADPLALGFASIGFDRDVRYLGLRMRRTAPPVFPSLEEIESERYGLAKVIYVYLPAEARPAAVVALDYLFSADGRAAMESTRVWAIPRERAAVELPR
jgi:phosphate transport system substrate-binding protein